jgi:hypothetical protein
MVHIFPSIIPETRCSKIPELQEENVVEHLRARTINESQYEDTLIPASERIFGRKLW